MNIKKKIKTESQEQKALVMKLRWQHPDVHFFAIPNGGKRGKGEARQLVLEGVEKGTPDIFIAEPRKGFHGLFIELKRSDKSLSTTSKEQEMKHLQLLERGYEVKVSYGAEEAYKEILIYLGKLDA